MSTPMMKCGHAANAISNRGPACFICFCRDVDDSPATFEGRLARCTYYGRPPLRLRDMGGCDTRSREEMVCRCEVPSSTDLWFFEYQPDGEFDRYYCGCHGYD